MPKTEDIESDQILFRIFADETGKAFLLYEPMNQLVEVTKPITKLSLEEAKQQLIKQVRAAFKSEFEKHEGVDDTTANPQQSTNRQIKKAVAVDPRGTFWNYVTSYLKRFEQGLFTVCGVVFMIALIYKGVELSQTRLPEWLHIAVLAFYVLGLSYCVYLMANEERIQKGLDRIRFLFGPSGLIVLPSLTLVVAASVFASVTLVLYRHGYVALQECTGRPVTEGSLLDFYMWHFLKLVPLVKLTEVLKIGEPLCYTQKRIGLLILLFQALVVLPSINTVLYYWKHRKRLSRSSIDYVYETGWQPGQDEEKDKQKNN